MPVFGFEKHQNRIKLSSAIRQSVSVGAPSDDLMSRSNVRRHFNDEDETTRLIRAYFGDNKFPLHCRRTLDQFTYHMLDDTEKRDNTQVMFKWFASQSKRNANQKRRFQWLPSESVDENDYPILMVDQLWLWILEDEQTVITSIPNTWEPTEDYNLVRYIMQQMIANKDRPVIEGPLDLVSLIVQCSVDILQRPGPHKAKLYDCFQSSIAVIVRPLSSTHE